MKTTKFHKAKNATVLKHTHTKGIDIGDYYFTVVCSNSQFLERFGNRSFQAAISFANSI